ncbi:MAG: pilus assembly protein [Clostridia bacterium]|nr:pilus assembly protein [Clostridia bacterium]
MKSSKLWLTNYKKKEEGQAVIETVLVIPIILTLVMVGITVALFIHANIIVTMSASNGARVGASIWHDTEKTMAEKEEMIKNAALSMVESSLSGEERRYKISEVDGMLSVTVEYDFEILLPFSNLVFDHNTVTIDHTTQYYIGED